MTAIGRIMAFAGLAWLVGCGPSLHIEGTWKGNRVIEGQPGADPLILRDLGRIELMVDSKGRFTLMERGMPKTGNIIPSSDGATLRVEQVAGQPIERTGPESSKTLKRGPNGTLIYSDPAIEEKPVTLTKSDGKL
jgi:hypothetical protein